MADLEFQDLGRGPGVEESLGSGECSDAPSRTRYVYFSEKYCNIAY